MDSSLQRFALLFLLLIWPLQSAFAAGDTNIYAVHGIQVDASAETAAAARDKAIAQGARKGLEQLMQNLTGADEKALPPISDKTAAPLVLDFDVESERSSATRYIASMGFRYRPDGVKALLANVKTHIIPRGPLVLVVPVYRSAAGDLLWQGDNPWRAAWKDADRKAGLVPVVVAAGTPEDVQMFTAGDLDDPAKLSELAANYKADNAVIVIASAVSEKGDPAEGMNITLSGGGGPDTTFKSPGGATPALALDQGVTATLNDLDTIWRQTSLKGTVGAVNFKASMSAPSTQTDAPMAPVVEDKPVGNQFAMRAALNGPGQWSALRTKLGQMPGISHVELKTLARDEVVFTAYVTGDEDRLAKILSDGNMVLGAPQAVPSGSGDLSSVVPVTGPGAGYIYQISGADKAQ